MTRARTGDIKKFIKEETTKNDGKPPRIFGAKGWESTLTQENWNKISEETVLNANKRKSKAS